MNKISSLFSYLILSLIHILRHAEKEYEKQQSELAAMRDYVAKNLAKSSSSNSVGSRVKALEKMAREGLADFVDVFCDKGFFTVEQTARILRAGAEYGMRPKIHANELAAMRDYVAKNLAKSSSSNSVGCLLYTSRCV